MITKNLMISVIVFIGIVFVSLSVYSFVRYYITSKRNAEAERANEMIFLAKIQAQRKEQESSNHGSIEYNPNQKLSDFSKRKIIVENDNNPDAEDAPVVPHIPVEESNTRKLNEFFSE